MEEKLQEHKQELERMKIAAAVTKKQLAMETYLKKKVKEVNTFLLKLLKELMSFKSWPFQCHFLLFVFIIMKST